MLLHDLGRRNQIVVSQAPVFPLEQKLLMDCDRDLTETISGAWRVCYEHRADLTIVLF